MATGNVSILLILFRLLKMHCKWTFAECFTTGSPNFRPGGTYAITQLFGSRTSYVMRLCRDIPGYILPNQIFRKYIVFVTDKLVSRAGFGPRAVVWRPLLYHKENALYVTATVTKFALRWRSNAFHTLRVSPLSRVARPLEIFLRTFFQWGTVSGVKRSGDARDACLQNVTVFEKQVVSTDATATKRSLCQLIATDILALGNVWGLIWRRFSVRLSLLLLSFWQLWFHVSIHGTVSLFFQTLESEVRFRAGVSNSFQFQGHFRHI